MRVRAYRKNIKIGTNAYQKYQFQTLKVKIWSVNVCRANLIARKWRLHRMDNSFKSNQIHNNLKITYKHYLLLVQKMDPEHLATSPTNHHLRIQLTLKRKNRKMIKFYLKNWSKNKKFYIQIFWGYKNEFR